IDFCQDRRGEVIDYVQQRYGRDQVAQIITFGTLQARGVLRDVGRVLEMPYGQVDKLCKLVPFNPAAPVTLARAIEGEKLLREAAEQDARVKRAFDIALKLEGLYRHASTHAAGIVIGDRPLAELIPLYRDPKSDMPVTQFSMKWVEQAGLVKFDFLGLKTLTVIEAATRLLARRGVQMDIQKIPLDDKKSYDLLSRGETVGVFQIESTGMRKALVDMRPDRLEDIIALVALYRPGPMANIPTYNMRKHGQERPDYIHPKLEAILKETFGVIIYQEQVMQIAQELAGFTLGQADLLRRAMGKKIRKEMAAQRDRFVSGAIGNGVERYRAEDIFELLAKFADYGFNKSHAAAYAMVAYQTAYLKANYPVEFLAASMTLDMGNTDKLAEFHRDADRQGIKVFPPSVNLSAREFEVHEGAIVYALAAIKGVGGQSVDAIVAARGDKPFVDLADFAMRVDPRAINKRTLECLATAGAFDGLEPNRAAAFAAVDSMLAFAQRAGANKATGQSELFSGAGTRPTLQVPAVAAWLPSELLKREYDAIGYFLSGHPLDDYAVALARLRVPKWAEFSRALRANMDPGKQLAATVVSRVERRTRTGGKIGIIGLSDPTGHFEAVLFQEGLAQYRDLLEPGTPVLLQVNAEMQGEDVRVRIFQAEHLDQAAAKTQRGLRVFVNSPEPIDFVAARLNGTHGNGKSEAAGEVSLVLVLPDRSEVEVKLPGRYAVTPAIAGAIKAVPGVVEVQAL
ncbi:MAG TPA: DNA polymerase III subunit alpha, partial [Xanthobacteraceae bacterium]|nr:DNA polymerase III subunit alpha [Xanthobacteraceae bacterium]